MRFTPIARSIPLFNLFISRVLVTVTDSPFETSVFTDIERTSSPYDCRWIAQLGEGGIELSKCRVGTAAVKVSSHFSRTPRFPLNLAWFETFFDVFLSILSPTHIFYPLGNGLDLPHFQMWQRWQKSSLTVGRDWMLESKKTGGTETSYRAWRSRSVEVLCYLYLHLLLR